MATITVSLKVLPGGLVGKAEVYAAVDRAIAVVQASGLVHLVGPSETTIEGEYDEVMAVVKQAQLAALDAAPRIFTQIGVDWNPQGTSIDEKLEKYR
ncbi:thiamine-binding protein [Chloroflexia bacterium SDU3-3]|nr:thiamine-binding protein [Chloroflexia bacterium SDU3-3]